MKKLKISTYAVAIMLMLHLNSDAQENLTLTENGYLHAPGLDVTFFSDFYPDGHQSGVTIIMHGSRIAANGDIRLEPSPGQWSPTPTGGEVSADPSSATLQKRLSFPNPERNRVSFNPIIYPDFEFSYTIRIQPAGGNSFSVIVDLDEPLPEEWVGKVGFNLELFPGELFGKSWIMDDQTGYFQVQSPGQLVMFDTSYISAPLATGKELVISPEDPKTMMTIETNNQPLELRDGRTNHNNGWFIVRTTIPGDAAKNAIELTITPNVIPGWKYEPVIQVSQIGYHPDQSKVAIIEMDDIETKTMEYQIFRSGKNGREMVQSGTPGTWGNFLRYKYATIDFSEINQPGIYTISYAGKTSHPFRIDKNIYNENTWQPTLEYYLPVQMCHMRVNEKYRVWHDLCHLDDALMAPTDHLHFDGYKQGTETYTDHEPGDPVPGLNKGGWHDAGDYDLRVESQAGTVRMLAWMIEEFGLEWDATMIDQDQKLVEIHEPDGVSDVIQQIEHGLLTILGGYKSLGRLYRGIICQDLRQYVMLGDASAMTDNLVFDPSLTAGKRTGNSSGINDDRWVFTEDNPDRELQVAAALTAASRVLKDHNPEMSSDAQEVALALYQMAKDRRVRSSSKVLALCELILTTEDAELISELTGMEETITENIRSCGTSLGRVIHMIDNRTFKQNIESAVAAYQEKLEKDQAEDSPYGVPYRPNIWGAGWNIQRFGVDQYFFHKGWPEVSSTLYFENALNFVLGVHPGINNASFVSGVGSKSITTAYGVNRADWSFIPGGVASGTALIRPDLPEMKEWPFFWQQTEYVMGGGGTNFMFLVLAVHQLYNGS
ncbi:MAG: glycoside hydrolase family 9 protein [Bacteroidales bacterium]|nr:glycoside hydrolase family 9 protein [Bacteroidales bacterium]